jgi:twitching motility protein PilT
MPWRISELLSLAVRLNASDVHLTAGSPPALRTYGELLPLSAPEWGELGLPPEKKSPLTAEETDALAREIMGQYRYEQFRQTGEIDLAYALPEEGGRFRVNAYRSKGSTALALRLVPASIPALAELGLPAVVGELAKRPRGLVLVTGPTGSGKTTTLAAMVDLINETKRGHIITLEDPIEYVHRHKLCLVNQREIGQDSLSFAAALRASLREDPDVILVGEMRDLETIATAITAAETGRLVLATLHTSGAAQTIDRIIDVFPPHQQQQVRVQLADVLAGVISQVLLPRFDRPGRTVAVEVLVATYAIRNLIREGKTHQIISQMQAGGRYGMQTFDSALRDLYRAGIISREEAVTWSRDPNFERSLR